MTKIDQIQVRSNRSKFVNISLVRTSFNKKINFLEELSLYATNSDFLIHIYLCNLVVEDYLNS